MGSRNILLQVFHPHWFESRANKRLAAAARRVPSLSFQQMETQYGDYLERADVERERVRIQNADILVMQFPIWSMTSAKLHFSRPPFDENSSRLRIVNLSTHT